MSSIYVSEFKNFITLNRHSINFNSILRKQCAQYHSISLNLSLSNYKNHLIMKKGILLFSAVALFTFSGSFAQESSKKAPKSKSSKVVVASKVQGAGINFVNEIMDYGTIAHKSDGAREFVFTNNGTTPLIIMNAQGSCGCTVPTWPRTPIAPGEKAVIGVKYDTNRPGPFTKTITLTSNSTTTPSKVLTIKGNVLAESAPAGVKS
jgi:hypothetical protein